MERITIERAEKFADAITRKLAAEKVDINDHDKAIKTLSKCVMGGLMVKAFKLLEGIK